MPTCDPNVPYEDLEARQWWIDTVDAAIQATPFEDTFPWVMEVDCPRCCHRIRTEIEAPDYGLLTIEGMEFDLDDYPYISVACDCKDVHKDRPPELDGCGWFFDRFTSPWKR